MLDATTETETCGADATVLASAFDALVAVLVETAEVLPHFLLPGADLVAIVQVLEGGTQSSDCVLVELVLVALQVAELGELLVALVKAAGEGFGGCVDNLVCSNVTALGECLAAELAAVGPFASVSAFVCLEVAELRKTLATAGFLAHERLDPGVCPSVNLEVGLLVK